MMPYSAQPTHDRAKWTYPRVYRTSVAAPSQFPRAVILRSSCGHMLGIGYVWKRQGFVAWKRCDS